MKQTRTNKKVKSEKTKLKLNSNNSDNPYQNKNNCSNNPTKSENNPPRTSRDNNYTKFITQD